MRKYLNYLLILCLFSCRNTENNVGIISTKKIYHGGKGGTDYIFIIEGKDDNGVPVTGSCYVTHETFDDYTEGEIYPHGVSYIEPRNN